MEVVKEKEVMQEMEEKGGLEEKEQISNTGILDVVDLAGLLRVSVQTARRYINKGKIPAYQVVPGKYLISTNQLIKHIEKRSYR